jgi:hypothetical protein
MLLIASSISLMSDVPAADVLRVPVGLREAADLGAQLLADRESGRVALSAFHR